ncbi:Putative lipoprotein [Croceitalea dokdonensis DOKDO 023]|uniref:Putative lipoprotein n=1 Tax=Croceitalea dokdonensis DOKDO 023 TaxID=1300341 RepID=A0A0P7AWW8_9FLAO|nr:Putative lipoprotein [Croceitalea dokdonensis DOKDO 023]
MENYDKVIVSPHIAVTFVAGASESVSIHTSTEPLDKLTIEVVGNTLRLYLEGAKTYTDTEKVKGDQYEYNNPIYKGTVVTATVTYTQLKELSLRGEEKFTIEDRLTAEDFTLKMFGESQVYFDEVDFDNLKTTIYGESYLELKKGQITKQKITAYGETTINTLGVETRTTKITVFGEGSYRIAVEDKLKVTAFGEATIAYKGSPDISRGMVIGEAKIQQID